MKQILLLTIWMSAIQGYAQSDIPDNMRYLRTQKKQTFAIQPYQLFNNSLRFDYEIRLGNGPGWLQFGPAFYLSAKGNMNGSDYYYYGNDCYSSNFFDFRFREPYSELLGGGIDINYKYFFDSRRSLYMACGLSYTYFDIKYLGTAWLNYTEYGLQYHEYVYGKYTQYIHRTGLNCLMGYQIPSRHAFLFDMFWGFACRYSFANEKKPAFNNYMYSFGYNGFVFLTGVRLGIGK